MSLLNDVLKDLDQRESGQRCARGVPDSLLLPPQSTFWPGNDKPISILILVALFLLCIAWFSWQWLLTTRTAGIATAEVASQLGSGSVRQARPAALAQTEKPKFVAKLADLEKMAKRPAGSEADALEKRRVGGQHGDLEHARGSRQDNEAKTRWQTSKEAEQAPREATRANVIADRADNSAAVVSERSPAMTDQQQVIFHHTKDNRSGYEADQSDTDKPKLQDTFTGFSADTALTTAVNPPRTKVSLTEAPSVSDGSIRPSADPVAVANRTLNKARRLYRNGNPRMAEQMVQRLLIVSSDHMPSQIQLSGWLLARGAYPQVAALLSAVTPGSLPELRVLKAHSLIAGGKDQQALALLQNNLPLVTDYPEFHSLRAGLLQQNGQYADALMIYAELVEVDPDEGAWWAGLGISLDQTGRHTSAFRAYVQALADPDLSSQLALYADQRIHRISSRNIN